MSLYQWLCLLGAQGVITLILSRVISKKLNSADAKAEQAKRETEAIAEGVKALLRDRLLQGYKHYIEKGWADMDAPAVPAKHDRGFCVTVFFFMSLGGEPYMLP